MAYFLCIAGTFVFTAIATKSLLKNNVSDILKHYSDSELREKLQDFVNYY